MTKLRRSRRLASTADRSEPPEPCKNAPVKKQKKKRGRPRKQPIQETPTEAEDAQDAQETPFDSIPMTIDAFSSNRCTFILDPFTEVDVDMDWLFNCYKPNERYILEEEAPVVQEKHLTFLSETNPEFWDCVYPPYQELPSDWRYTSPLQNYEDLGAEERQLDYLRRNFIKPNLGELEDSGDSDIEWLDAEEEVHYEWKDVYNCCVELDKADKTTDSAVNISLEDTVEDDEEKGHRSGELREALDLQIVATLAGENEEENTDGSIDTREATHRQFSDTPFTSYADTMEDQLAQSHLSETPRKDDNSHKQSQESSLSPSEELLAPSVKSALPQNPLESFIALPGHSGISPSLPANVAAPPPLSPSPLDLHHKVNNEEEKTGGIVEAREATGPQISATTSTNCNDEMEDQLVQPNVSEAPRHEYKVQRLRGLCSYCDDIVTQKDVMDLSSPSLENFLLRLSNGDVRVANRMKEDMGRWGSFKVCKKHAQSPPGRVRLSKDRLLFVPDDVAIARWKTRIQDDEDGKMMTFAAAIELGLRPRTAKRCVYCSQQSHHTISFPCAKSKDSRFDLDAWIDALALGNQRVELILQKIFFPPDDTIGPTSRRFLCASHFRRSSFIVSDTIVRHIRLRRNEAPIGDERINDVLLLGDESATNGLDQRKCLEMSIPAKRRVWLIDPLGGLAKFSELTGLHNYYLDLPQMLPDGVVIHRFCCSTDTEEMICFACNIVRRDLIGIMSQRTPGLGVSPPKEKQSPPPFAMWIKENRVAIRRKMDEEKTSEFMKIAIAMWDDVDIETKEELLQRRTRMCEEYDAEPEERASAEMAIAKLLPAKIIVRGDQLLTDVDSLEHLCIQYHSPFRQFYITPTGYFPPELQLMDYEVERHMYYTSLQDELSVQTTGKRPAPPVDVEVGGKKKKSVTFRTVPLKSHSEEIARCMKPPDMEMSEWKKVFLHDHCYCNPEALAGTPFPNLIPVVGHLTIPSQTLPRSNLACSSSSTQVSPQLAAVSNASLTTSVATGAAKCQLPALRRSEGRSSRGIGRDSLLADSLNRLITISHDGSFRPIASTATATRPQSIRPSPSEELPAPFHTMKSMLLVQDPARGSLEPARHPRTSPSVNVASPPPVLPSPSAQPDRQSKSPPKGLPSVAADLSFHSEKCATTKAVRSVETISEGMKKLD